MSKARKSARTSTLVERAPAKVNLTLAVLGRRADGYHNIESLVAFATFGDRLTLVPGPKLELAVTGPAAAAAGPAAENLVLKAAHALGREVRGLKLGRFILAKRLPVAAGLGGGSADAAAALRLLALRNGIALGDPRLRKAARKVGADVPVCLDPRARLMRGIGDVLSVPLKLPRLAVVLANPGVALATKHVFAALRPPRVKSSRNADLRDVPSPPEELLALLADRGNDLEAAAIGLAPSIAKVLTALTNCSGCRLARMSGSGATCFGLFVSGRAARAAARKLKRDHPRWWVRATFLR